jgi:GNAT superfamily N-acetyltransferase
MELGNAYAVIDPRQQEDDKRVMYLQSVDVSDEHQGKGIGSYLIAFVVETAHELGMDVIKLDDSSDFFNKPAENIYSKFGFQYFEDGDSTMEARVNDLLAGKRYNRFKTVPDDFEIRWEKTRISIEEGERFELRAYFHSTKKLKTFGKKSTKK